MVDVKHSSPKRRRSRSGSSTSSTNSKSRSSSGSSSGSSSSGSSSSSSSSKSSRSPIPRRRNSRNRDNRRPAGPRRSRSIRRSPANRTIHSDRRSKERGNFGTYRRSPSSIRRRVSPVERRRRSRSRSHLASRRGGSPVPRRGNSPSRRSAASPLSQEPRRFSVRNLSRNLTKEHLSEIFSIYGALKSCEMPADRIHPHLNRGYGYIEYEKADDAEKAMKHMDGGQIDGIEIQCEPTIPYRNSVGGGVNRNRSPLRGRGSSPAQRRAASPRRNSPSRRAGSPPRRRRSPRSITGANSIPLGRRSRSRSPRR